MYVTVWPSSMVVMAPADVIVSAPSWSDAPARLMMVPVSLVTSMVPVTVFAVVSLLMLDRVDHVDPV